MTSQGSQRSGQRTSSFCSKMCLQKYRTASMSAVCRASSSPGEQHTAHVGLGLCTTTVRTLCALGHPQHIRLYQLALSNTHTASISSMTQCQNVLLSKCSEGHVVFVTIPRRRHSRLCVCLTPTQTPHCQPNDEPHTFRTYLLEFSCRCVFRYWN